jgi:hypothetical protein
VARRSLRTVLALLAVLAPLPLAAHAAEPARYEVVASPGGEVLRVEARYPGGAPSTLAVDRALAPFIADAAAETTAGWQRLEGWRLPAGATHLRYRFLLGRAADAVGDVDVAARRGRTLVAPPATWLLRPDVRERLPYEVKVTTAAGETFASPLPAVAPGRYTGTFGPQGVAPYAGFGRFAQETLSVGGGRIELAVAHPALDRDRTAVRRWVLTAARAVSAYFGRLPVPQVLVLVVEKGRGVFGKQMGDGEASVLLEVAPGADLRDPEWDWMATHEMVHLASPSLPRRHLWLEEGLATYVEPIARAAVGDMTAAVVWREMVQGMPRGEPGPGEHGLDRSGTWASTYWGGALFCLEADLEIRRATGGAQSLQSALRAVLAAGGDARARWAIDRFLDVADAALGRPVLRPLYERMALTRGEVDLPALWARLGVVAGHGGVTFDDRAPEAALRRSITTW